MAVAEQRPFVSLFWKITVSLGLLLLVIVALAFWLGYQRLNELVWQNYSDLFTSRESEFLRIIETENSNSEQLLQYLLSLSQSEAGSDAARLNRHFQQAWGDMQFRNGFKGLLITDESDTTLTQQGITLDAPFLTEQKRQSEEMLQPVFTIRCDNQCLLYQTFPVYTPSGNMLMVQYAKDVEDTVFMIKISQDVDIGLLSIPQTSLEKGRLDQVEIHSVSAGITELQLRELLTSQPDIDLLMEQPQRSSLADQQWLIKLRPVTTDGGDVFLVSVGNVTSSIQELSSFEVEATYTTVLAVLALLIITLLVMWRPMTRIQKQVKILPLLSSGEFEAFEAVMDHTENQPLFFDEINLLEDSTIELADQLKQFRDEIEGKTEKLRKAAYFDSLTGLGNRNYLHFRLKEMLRSSRLEGNILTVLFIDLDDFKTINDMLGHNAGDELLVIMAKKLKSSLRTGDLVVRLGGDEFVTVLEAPDEESIQFTVKKLLERLNTTVAIKGYSIRITTSVGVVIAGEDDTPNDLLRKSDIAMYESKRSGKSELTLYHQDMSANISKRFEVLSEYERALENDEFFFVAQPQYHLDNSTLRGFEILARWQHPVKGMVPPGDFIPYLESSPHADSFGVWTIEQAVSFAAELYKLHPEPALVVSLNMIPIHFSEPKLPSMLVEACKKAAVPHRCIEVEITENMLMSGGDQENTVLAEIRELGFSVAVDDFGTGYSSLAYLQYLPVDVLKIDMAFIKGMTENKVDEKIVELVINLGKAMELEIVAEGVEGPEHETRLIAYGEVIGQGYGLGKPMPRDDARNLVIKELETTQQGG